MQRTKESDIQAAICDYLSLKGYLFSRTNNSPIYDKTRGAFRALPKYRRRGWPDICLIRNGEFYGIEGEIGARQGIGRPARIGNAHREERRPLYRCAIDRRHPSCRPINDEEPNTYLLDHNPAKLLPCSKRLIPEDDGVERLPKQYQPSDPRLFGENYN
jgi:hypothetical protein